VASLNPDVKFECYNLWTARQHPSLTIRFSNRDKRNEILHRKKYSKYNKKINSVFGFANISTNKNLTDHGRVLYNAAIETKLNLKLGKEYQTLKFMVIWVF